MAALVRCRFENLFWSTVKNGDQFIRQMELDDAASRKRRARGPWKRAPGAVELARLDKVLTCPDVG